MLPGHITVGATLQGLTVGQVGGLAVKLTALCATAIVARCSSSMHPDSGFLATLGIHACAGARHMRLTCTSPDTNVPINTFAVDS